MRKEKIAGLTVRWVGGSDGKGGGDAPVMVLLHGFGAPGDDLVPLANVYRLPWRFAFPEAPIPLDPWNMMRAWWQIDMSRFEREVQASDVGRFLAEIPQGLAEARAQVMELLAVFEKDYNAPTEQVVLGGFSQGAMLSCDVSLHTEKALRGVVLYSPTYLAESVWKPRMRRTTPLRYFLSHGTRDPLLPFAGSLLLRDALREAGNQAEWCEFVGFHEIPMVALSGSTQFLQSLLHT